ncbi:MAG: serine/threonine protein kinase [Deferribacteres bacterium]|nr:serine/threonine protein kinase [candidate division KSB1 bacterium]MCB9511258.1 serine/threonine protein kinase [Deferribacteres bacterium]
MIDSKISHFKILEKLGEGGMGEIYLAEDTLLNRKVALKQLPAHLIEKQELVIRFKREARAAAALKHPNIVTVYELFEHENRIFIAMEYIEGANLYEFRKQRTITIKQALVIILHICKGLRVAHKNGIIHRDIKPANIMIDKDGWVKLLDFGLAKLVANKTITRIGSKMGTVPYFSPEQLRGEEAAPGTDIFSLGIILYELIAGRRPFEGDSEESIIYHILHKKPERLAKFNPQVTPRLQKVVDKALNKNSRRRYQSIGHFMHDLERERRYYSKLQEAAASTAAKNSVARSVSLYLKDIEYEINRFGLSRLISRLGSMNQLLRTKLILLRQKTALPAGLLVIFATLSGTFLILKGSHHGESNVSIMQASPIRTLVNIKETPRLLKAFEEFSQRDLIRTGEKANPKDSNSFYLFVFDSQRVADVLIPQGDDLYSLYSKKTLQKSKNHLPGKYRIWVKDLSKSRH